MPLLKGLWCAPLGRVLTRHRPPHGPRGQRTPHEVRGGRRPLLSLSVSCSTDPDPSAFCVSIRLPLPATFHVSRCAVPCDLPCGLLALPVLLRSLAGPGCDCRPCSHSPTPGMLRLPVPSSSAKSAPQREAAP